jgi:hypothetical protein
MRNIIMRGRGRVSIASDTLVRDMLTRWDASTSTLLTQYSEVDHLLGYTECLHTKLEMKWSDDKGLLELVDRVAATLQMHACEDVIRFDPSSTHTIPTTQAGYCKRCARFQTTNHKSCPRYVYVHVYMYAQ